MSTAHSDPGPADDDPGLSGMGAQWEAGLPWNQAPPTAPTTPTPGRRRSSKPPKRRPRTAAIVVAAAVIVVAAVLGVRAMAGGDPTNDKDTANASATPSIVLGRPTPPGWTNEVAWRTTAPLNSDVAVGDDKVLYIAPSGSAVVVDATTGDSLFSTVPANLGGGTAQVAIVGTPAGPTAVAWGTESLTAWPMASTGSSVEGTTIPLPKNTTVFVDGGGLMASSSEGAWVLDGQALAKVSVPAGAQPLAALEDGSLVAAPPAGPVTVIPRSGKPTTVRLKMAKGATGDTMYPARSAAGVVVAWAPTKADDKRAVAFYRVKDGALMAQGTLPTDVVNQGLPLAVSPDMSLASAGPLLANLTNDHTTVADGWSATIAVQDQLYGAVSGQRVVWQGKGDTEPLDEGAAIPWGVTSKNLAIVTEQVGGEQTLNGLVAN